MTGNVEQREIRGIKLKQMAGSVKLAAFHVSYYGTFDVKACITVQSVKSTFLRTLQKELVKQNFMYCDISPSFYCSLKSTMTMRTNDRLQVIGSCAVWLFRANELDGLVQ